MKAGLSARCSQNWPVRIPCSEFSTPYFRMRPRTLRNSQIICIVSLQERESMLRSKLASEDPVLGLLHAVLSHVPQNAQKRPFVPYVFPTRMRVPCGQNWPVRIPCTVHAQKVRGPCGLNWPVRIPCSEISTPHSRLRQVLCIFSVKSERS